MATWELVDFAQPADAPDEFPSELINSETQSRDVLHRLRQRKPTLVALNSPRGEALQIGIGGPFAGVRWWEGAGSQRGRVVLADSPHCHERVDFASEEDTIAFWPNELLPVGQAMEVIVFFYNQGQFPPWISWKEWNPVAKNWETRQAQETPPTFNNTHDGQRKDVTSAVPVQKD